MKKRIVPMMVVTGIAFVLSGGLAWAVPDNTNGCGPSGGQPKKCNATVPEATSLILLGVGVAGVGIWRRMSGKN
jgi:hypothetical protein